MADTSDSYRSLDYSDNLQLLKRKGYKYLTFYELRPVDGGDLKNELGYEHVQFLEAVPSVKPLEDDGYDVICVPINSEDVIILLDSDEKTYQIKASYF